jgi:hypothetical protein
MKGAAEVSRKFGVIFSIGAAWAFGMTAGTGAPLPANQEISTAAATASLTVTVPEGGWHLRIERVFEFEKEIWVLAQLQHTRGPSTQAIQTVQAALPAGLPAKAQRVFIAGKTWSWANPESYEFVPLLSAVIKQAGSARVLYPAPDG